MLRSRLQLVAKRGSPAVDQPIAASAERFRKLFPKFDLHKHRNPLTKTEYDDLKRQGSKHAASVALDADRCGVCEPLIAAPSGLERIMGTNDMVDINFLELGTAVARGVCRIVTDNGLGTGFLIAPGLVMTNNHVLPSESATAGGVAEFDYALDGNLQTKAYQFKLLPDKYFRTSPADELDYTIVQVADTSSRGGRPLTAYPYLRFSEKVPLPGTYANAIQHPKGGLKKIAFRNNDIFKPLIARVPPNLADFLHYRTDTEPGSSGSPMLDDQWKVVALHHSGVPRTDRQGQYLDKNGNATDDPDLVDWIANEGIRATKLLDICRALRLPVNEAKQPNPIALARTAKSGGNRAFFMNRGAGGAGFLRGGGALAAPGAGGGATLTVPVTLTIAASWVGSAAPSTVDAATDAAAAMSDATTATSATDDAAPTPSLVEEATVRRRVSEFADCKGFNEKFLGISCPMPKTPAGGKVLKYHNYTVVMNPDRRAAYVSAVNTDGSKLQSGSRSNKWFVDPRIAEDEQLGDDIYKNITNNFDRGHLTAYADLNVARPANTGDFSFSFCNAVPQTKEFNGSRGKDLWIGLEEYVRKFSVGSPVSVFNGPVFRDDDPVAEHGSAQGVQFPVSFYKVICHANGSKLVTSAFIMDQADTASKLEKFDAKLWHVPVSEVESKTGLKFAAAIKAGDIFGKRPAGSLEKAGGIRGVEVTSTTHFAEFYAKKSKKPSHK